MLPIELSETFGWRRRALIQARTRVVILWRSAPEANPISSLRHDAGLSMNQGFGVPAFSRLGVPMRFMVPMHDFTTEAALQEPSFAARLANVLLSPRERAGVRGSFRQSLF